MKKQGKILEDMRIELDELKNKKSPHAELIRFLTVYFDTLLESCQRYVGLYDDITKNCAFYAKSGQTEKIIGYLVNVQEKNASETQDKLSAVVQKVD